MLGEGLLGTLDNHCVIRPGINDCASMPGWNLGSVGLDSVTSPVHEEFDADMI